MEISSLRCMVNDDDREVLYAATWCPECIIKSRLGVDQQCVYHDVDNLLNIEILCLLCCINSLSLGVKIFDSNELFNPSSILAEVKL